MHSGKNFCILILFSLCFCLSTPGWHRVILVIGTNCGGNDSAEKHNTLITLNEPSVGPFINKSGAPSIRSFPIGTLKQTETRALRAQHREAHVPAKNYVYIDDAGMRGYRSHPRKYMCALLLWPIGTQWRIQGGGQGGQDPPWDSREKNPAHGKIAFICWRIVSKLDD